MENNLLRVEDYMGRLIFSMYSTKRKTINGVCPNLGNSYEIEFCAKLQNLVLSPNYMCSNESLKNSILLQEDGLRQRS